jgi:hypothetical protein
MREEISEHEVFAQVLRISKLEVSGQPKVRGLAARAFMSREPLSHFLCKFFKIRANNSRKSQSSVLRKNKIKKC